MWTVAANNKKFPDALGTYNSLYDPHLHQYFRKPKVRSHLVHAGLMSNEGRVIPEAVLRLRKLEDERRKQLHQLLNEVLEKGQTNRLGLIRLHETRDLESEAKNDLVQRAKLAFHSNTTSTGETTRTQSNNSSSGRTKQSSYSVQSMNWFKRVVHIKPKIFANSRKRRVRVNNSYNRYQRPKSSYGIRASNRVKPDLLTDEELNEQFSDILSLDGSSLHDSDDSYERGRTGLWAKKARNAVIYFRFNGLTTNCLIPRRIQISQQLNSGGNAITIFDKMIEPGESFSFEVRPHGSRPFCITVLIDGIRDLRVSTCCEHKHRKGSKISHFTLIDVRGGKMCAKCKKALNSAKTQSITTSAVSEPKEVITSEQNGVFESKNDEIKSESDVEECEETVIERTKQSSRSSTPIDGDYNEDQFENYDSEFEVETPDSVRIRSNSVSSDECSQVNGRRELVEAEIHKHPAD